MARLALATLGAAARLRGCLGGLALAVVSVLSAVAVWSPACVRGPAPAVCGPGGGRPRLEQRRADPDRLATGRAPATPDEVIPDATQATQADLGVGAPVWITSTGGTGGYTVVGLARPPPGHQWQGPVFVTDALAARLSADPGRVDALGVRLEDGADPEHVAQQIAGHSAGASACTPAATEAGWSRLRACSATRSSSRWVAPSGVSRRCWRSSWSRPPSACRCCSAAGSWRCSAWSVPSPARPAAAGWGGCPGRA